MIQTRKSQERGHANHGWLDSFHTFSFAGYYDPDFMGFRELRVINEDRVAGGAGFPTHPHKDMEIITYVISGELAHKDTLGNQTRILPGEVQRMSAGTGIQHSEFNPLSNTETHLLQIWILPERQGIEPSYGQKSFAKELESGEFTLVASRSGRDGSVSINQDVDLYAAKWTTPRQHTFELRRDRYGWVQVVDGELDLNGKILKAGDAAAVADEPSLSFTAKSPTHLLFFNLP
jgi:quercetin 2,3-dioxygenase